MTTPAETLLSCLEGVQHRGAGRWFARCPAHDDRSPSLSIQETQEYKVLVHCFAGCGALEICAAVGLTLSDLFPALIEDDGKRRGRAKPVFTARDVLLLLDYESLIVAAIAANIVAGRGTGPDEVSRLMAARQKIDRMREVIG